MTIPPITADCTAGDASNCREIDEPGAGESTSITFLLTLAAAIDSDISVNYSSADGSATAGEDYMATSGSLQFPAGSTEASFVVTILGDDVSEDTETFTINLSASSSVSLPDSTLVFSILNDTVCFIEVNPNAVVATAAGGSGSFTVSSLDGCSWDVSTNVSWVTITSPSSNSGSGDVDLTIDAFDPPAGTFTRSGTVTVSLADPATTVDFIIDQDGDCSFSIDSSTTNFGPSGGSASFTVTPNDESCDWDVTSTADWLTITSPTDPVTGSGSVSYQVSENAGSANVSNSSRSITLTSEQFDYSVSQDGCSFALDSTSSSVAAAGDSAVSVALLAPTSAAGPCPWTAVSNATWILIAAGSSGSGGASVSLDVLENASVESRSGSVSIAGISYTVNQDGQACVYSLDPSSFDVCADGQSFNIDASASDGCSWSLSTGQSWLELIDNASGLGSETASGVVAANLSESSRSGSIDRLATRFAASVTQSSFNQEGYLIYEDFSAGLPIEWSFEPVADWQVLGTDLIGDQLNVGGIGIAFDPTTACRDCKVETTLLVSTVSSGTRDSATLMGWYEDDNNFVGLAMDEFTNHWRLFQLVNGVRSESEAAVDEIVPNVSYALTLRYDGTTFFADINGMNLAQLPKQANSDPFGFAGFRVNNNIARFSDLRVSGVANAFEVLFEDSYENVAPLVTSSCTF